MSDRMKGYFFWVDSGFGLCETEYEDYLYYAAQEDPCAAFAQNYRDMFKTSAPKQLVADGWREICERRENGELAGMPDADESAWARAAAADDNRRARINDKGKIDMRVGETIKSVYDAITAEKVLAAAERVGWAALLQMVEAR